MMYPIPNWPDEPTNLADHLSRELVFGCDCIQVPNSNLEDLLKSSEEFPIKFPLDSVRCKVIKTQYDEDKLEEYITSVYPVIHEKILLLYADFILHKRKYGNEFEKKLYESMTVVRLVDRFLTKRAVTFMGKFDDYLLLNNVKGRGKWNTIGTEHQDKNLSLENCLSYDEIKLSAFLSVSSYTYFVNNGQRKNKGVPAKDRSLVEPSGIIIGLIGACLKKKHCLEYQELIYSKEQNTEDNGYGTVLEPTTNYLFAGFYDKQSYKYADLLKAKVFKEPGYFTEISKGIYFDNITYAKRMALSIDTLLFEANHRAQACGKFAYIHVVGIGLGVWKCSTHQEELFMETFASRLELLGKYLHSISDIHFAYFSLSSSCGKYKHGSMVPCQGHPKEGIKIFVSKREPHTKLTGDNKGKLLVVSYAWDGNALPGNEFWLGKLCSTGDSAAAASTQISELHNPHINKMVTGNNLRIATRRGVFSVEKYMADFVVNKKKRTLHKDIESLSAKSSKHSAL